MTEFQPPPFDPHLLFRGGHLQTIVSIRSTLGTDLMPKQHTVAVSDGDAIVLHDDCPPEWREGDESMLLIHGLAGCHAAPYMLRLADQLVRRGVRVFRMDMRGCGAGHALAANLTHAGRSEDILVALDAIAQLTQAGPIAAAGISMGACQLLRAVGRIGAGKDAKPQWFDRLARIAAVAPPVDLQRCSDNMLRWSLRPYNYYFIRGLLARAPARVKQREDYQRELAAGRPKTLRELDDRFTAPLSGFADAVEYYSKSSANQVVRHNQVPTLVLAAADDPIVPIGCFVDDKDQWPASTRLVIAKTGGHVGFVDRRRSSWMDQLLWAWFDQQRRPGDGG